MKNINFGLIKSCIVCKNKTFEMWAQLESYKAKKCKKCGMISINPTPDQSFLNSYYEN